MRNHFENEMERLQMDILKMSSMVEESLLTSVTALKNKDVVSAQKVIDGDEAIDDKEIMIEDHCLKLIALQQPLAKDLRIIATALKIITDLERIADYSSDISKITLKVAGEEYVKALVDIPEMAHIAVEMIRMSIDAYINRNVEQAKQAAAMDDQVDLLQKKIFKDLVEIMVKHPEKVNQATLFLLVSRYLERIGDHITNICERIVYSETGVRIELN